jgi:hypothetical protein
MGAIRFSDKKHLVDFIAKGTGDTSLCVVRGFYMELKSEWAGDDKNDDKNIDDFEKDGPKIVVILDNSSIHKGRIFWSR